MVGIKNKIIVIVALIIGLVIGVIGVKTLGDNGRFASIYSENAVILLDTKTGIVYRYKDDIVRSLDVKEGKIVKYKVKRFEKK